MRGFKVKKKEETEHLHSSETFLASDHAPELVVIFQQSDYLSVKDIFIDSVVPSQGVSSYKDISSKFHRVADGESEEPNKTHRIWSSISNETGQDLQGYVRKRHALGNLMKDDEADHLEGRDGHLLCKSIESIKEFQVGDSVSLNSKERRASESIDDNSHLSDVSSNNDAQSGSTIHFSDQNLHRTEFRMSSNLKGPCQSFANELACGYCDPFAVSPLSGTGVSLRSTSSNASSQSFAFPILPSEWNGSPVRMAKADRRQLRKHQSWRACFLCSNF